MSLYLRVFAATDAPPPASLLVDALAAANVRAALRIDEGEWFRAEIDLGRGSPLLLERWLVDEPGIRAELNAWAGYLETLDYDPAHVPLMERTIQTRQLFTLRRPIDCPDEAAAERAGLAICRALAGHAGGFFQVDDRGFFAADGSPLLVEH